MEGTLWTIILTDDSALMACTDTGISSHGTHQGSMDP